jgi:predicted nucleic acid-binding protein
MSRIFWDTNLFIYLLEDYGSFSQDVADLRTKMLRRGDQLLTSAITVGEVLIKPMQLGHAGRCSRYEKLITSNATVIPFDVNAARHYASIKCDRSVKAPDAVQLACAASAGVDLFVTNDEHLRGRSVAGIQFIVPLNRVPI